MNTTATLHSETSWSRRCSTETVFSVQGKETDFVQDSSDTEVGSGDDRDVEYEPVTGTEEEAPISDDDSSGESESGLVMSGLILTLGDDGDLQLADSEAGSYATDSELDLPAYWSCARCRTQNDNTRYRYCHRCFKIRKNFFPPRPKRKEKRVQDSQETVVTLSQDSGIESHNSQEIVPATIAPELGKDRKRRAESAERAFKKPRLSEDPPAPLVKMNSDPAVTVESLGEDKDLCIVCLSSPKTGVFVHRRVAHICCCYSCARRVWASARRCPLCNCKVSNVLRAVVM